MKEKKIADLIKQDSGDGFFQDKIVANAPLLMAIFANFVVLVAEIRVFDVMYVLTGSWWKALSASLACAVPFVLWEVVWQYNHTTDGWRTTSLVMAGVAFATSIVLGVADFLNFTGEWADFLLGAVVVLTGAHTVVGLFYYYNDPDVARRRRKSQALAAMADQEMNAQVAESLLKSGQGLMGIIRDLEAKFSPDEVEAILAVVRGKKQADKPSQSTPVQRQERPQQTQRQMAVNSFAKDTEQAKLTDSPTSAGKQD